MSKKKRNKNTNSNNTEKLSDKELNSAAEAAPEAPEEAAASEDTAPEIPAEENTAKEIPPEIPEELNPEGKTREELIAEATEILSKPRGFMDTVMEVRRREEEAEEQQAREQWEEDRRERAAYEQDLQRQKIELMKLRQGVIEESDVIPEREPEREYTFAEKAESFLYLNKWWLIMAVFAVFVVGFLVYDYVSRVRPDMTIMILCNNYDLSVRTMEIEEYFEQFTPDANGDGKIHVGVYYIPTVANEDTSSYDIQTFIANQAKFMGEMGAPDSMVIIADTDSTNDNAGLDELLTDLTGKIDSPAVQGQKIMLKDTRFGEIVDCSVLPDDLYMGIREVQTAADYAEKMQKNYDTAIMAISEAVKDMAK